MTKVHIYPPLGTLTCVQQGAISIRVYIVTSEDDDRASAAELWTNMYGEEWQAVALSGDSDGEGAFLDASQVGAANASDIQQFSLGVQTASLASRFEFTVRWKTSKSGSWQWASTLGNNARVAIHRPTGDRQDTNSHYYWRKQLNGMVEAGGKHQPVAVADSWHASPRGATCVYRKASAAAACGADSSVELDSPAYFGRLANIERYLLFVRKDEFWIIPRCGAGLLPADRVEIVLMLVQLTTGAYVAMMPFCKCKGSTTTSPTTFKAGPSNTLHFCAEPSTYPDIRVAASISKYPHDAVLGAFDRIRQQIPSPQPALPVQMSSSGFPLANYMGYCTWNMFYQNVNHGGLLDVMHKIRQASQQTGQPYPGWVLIDDGWQTVSEYGSQGRLRDTCANTERFPGQLRDTVAALQSLGVKRVGVWHALWGYWGGIDPDSSLGQQYSLGKYHRRSTTAVKGELDVWLVSDSCISRFYDEFYKWLSSQGISFVKVDYQAAFETLDNVYNSTSALEMFRVYVAAVETSARKHFGDGSVIYCMSHSPQLILHALQQQQPASTTGSLPPAERMIFRNSDDYFPDVHDSHGWHIYANLTNTVWSHALAGYFAVDWDMFRPGGGDVGGLHATSRLISGGLFYITGSADDYMNADLSRFVGSSGKVGSCNRALPLVDSQCLFTDMTRTPGLLVSSTVVTQSASVLITVYNISKSPVIAPLFIPQLCNEAAEFNSRRNSSHAVLVEAVGGDLYSVHQMSTGRIRIVNMAQKAYALALRPLAADVLTVTKLTPFASLGKTRILYAACVGDTSRCAGIYAVERELRSVIAPSLPTSACSSGRLHGWNISAHVSAQSKHAVFVLRVRAAAALQMQTLPVSISCVCLSGNILDPRCWRYSQEAETLRVTLPPADGPAASLPITICLDM